jgi:hypothetical protein
MKISFMRNRRNRCIIEWRNIMYLYKISYYCQKFFQVDLRNQVSNGRLKQKTTNLNSFIVDSILRNM